MYENFYQEQVTSPTDSERASRSSAAGDGMLSLRGTTAPSTSTKTLGTLTQIMTSKSQQTVVPTKVTSCAPQTVTSFNLTSTGPMEGKV